jgi:hypothetical protein
MHFIRRLIFALAPLALTGTASATMVTVTCSTLKGSTESSPRCLPPEASRWPAGQSMTFPGLTGTDLATITDSSVSAPYVGAGNFNNPILTSSMLDITGVGGNFAGNQTTTANATASIAYKFGSTSTPEVSTPVYLVTGLGAILIGLLRRRSR